MNAVTIIFMAVATVFAIASLFYVGGSVIVQSRKEKKRKATAPVTEISHRSCGWLLLGSVLGATSGVLTAFVVTRSGKREKKTSGKRV